MQAAYRVSLGGLRPAPRRPRPTCPRVHVCRGADSQRERPAGPAPRPPAQRALLGHLQDGWGHREVCVRKRPASGAEAASAGHGREELQSRPVSAPCPPHPPNPTATFGTGLGVCFLRNKGNSALSCYSSVSRCLRCCFRCVQSGSDRGWSQKWLQLERGYS